MSLLRAYPTGIAFSQNSSKHAVNEGEVSRDAFRGLTSRLGQLLGPYLAILSLTPICEGIPGACIRRIAFASATSFATGNPGPTHEIRSLNPGELSG